MKDGGGPHQQGGDGNGKRNRRNRGGGGGGGGMREEFPDDEEFDVIPAAELESTKNAMNLAELKTRPAAALVQLAESMGLENLARSRKQEACRATMDVLLARGRKEEADRYRARLDELAAQ